MGFHPAALLSSGGWCVLAGCTRMSRETEALPAPELSKPGWPEATALLLVTKMETRPNGSCAELVGPSDATPPDPCITEM